MNMIMLVLSDKAFPRSYVNMEGFGVHIFLLINDKGETHFCKLHWKLLADVHSLVFEEAAKLAESIQNLPERENNNEKNEWLSAKSKTS